MTTERDLGKVVEHKNDLYETYDVTDKGYCTNCQPRKIIDVFNDVNQELKEKYPEICEGIDYFDLSLSTRIKPADPWDTSAHWTAVYYVRGGSEGFYIHVSTIHGGKHQMIFLGKTLLEGEAGLSWAEKMVAAISRIMKV